MPIAFAGFYHYHTQQSKVRSIRSLKLFANDKEALALANQTQYGLQAGTVSVNCYGEGDITTPFGGYKLSGFGGKDNSLMAHDQYTQTKTIWINLAENQQHEEIG